MNKKNLGIYGGGGLGKELWDTCYKLGITENIFFVADYDHNTNIAGRKVHTFEDILGKYKPQEVDFVVAVGEPKHRRRMYNKLESYSLSCTTVIGCSTEISSFAMIGNGTIIQPQSIVSGGVRIGFGCYLNFRVCVGHDTTVGEYCVLSPNVNIGGNVMIGNNCFLGNSAVIRDKIKIGENAIIGMGAVVTKDVPDNAVMVGNPARKMRENYTGTVFKLACPV